MFMATLFSERLAAGLAAAAAIAMLTGASGTLQGGVGKDPVRWVARSWDLDYKTRVTHLHGEVKISQGEMSVAADEAEATATSADSRNSHWVFTGNVHVRAERQGELHADRATVEITDGALASANVTGSPAQFEQTRATSERLVKGHAAAISYDVAAATVQLNGEAWLSDERNNNEMRSPSITYNMRDRQIAGDVGPAPGGRVKTTIVPKSVPGKP